MPPNPVFRGDMTPPSESSCLVDYNPYGVRLNKDKVGKGILNPPKNGVRLIFHQFRRMEALTENGPEIGEKEPDAGIISSG
jgi:hypothetical protein